MKRNLIYHTHIRLGKQITIETGQKNTAKTDLEAISRDGITINCDRSMLDQLLPNTASVIPKQPVSLSVSFNLDGSSGKVKANCNVVAVRRLSRDTYQMVMRFQDISECHFERVDRYIENSLNHACDDALEQVA